MSNVACVNNQSFAIKEYQGQRLVTFKDIDKLHQRPEGTAKRNFRTNIEHFRESVDYYKFCEDEIRTNKIMCLPPKVHQDMVFLTRTGYLMLVKSFTDDLAWKVQRELVETYFEKKQAPEQTQLPSSKYCYEPKTYHGQVVCTVRDIEHFTGIETHKISSKISNNKSLVHGTDYWMLEGNDLAYFKSKYPTIVTSVRHLFILTKSGFNKLFGTAPEYAKALPCYNIVQAKSEPFKQSVPPTKKIDVAKDLTIQGFIQKARRALNAVDYAFDCMNDRYLDENSYKQFCAVVHRFAFDLHDITSDMAKAWPK